MRGLKGLFQNKMKRNNHVDDFSSFCSETFPLALVLYAAFYRRIYLCFFLIGDGSIPTLSMDTIDHAGYR
jgi:hypothetical protein